MNILGKAQIKKYMCYKLNSLIIITVKKFLTAKKKNIYSLTPSQRDQGCARRVQEQQLMDFG